MEKWYEYDFAGKKILLAADNVAEVCNIQKLLEKVGFEVTVAANGRVALERCRQAGYGYYDAIIIDVNMPVLDGLTAMRVIRYLEDKTGVGHMPILAVMAENHEEILSARQAGSDENLLRPINSDLLLKLLSKYLKIENM